ncbi:hypothetical protein NC653_041465 [Populus alba x Populus x berolinensis]|uniref:Uncharacterized protein n=1 Tax=Populus alba x Populus x berolinensis TaxID=444605 RepID=A0AAD6PQS9_9ROSI|nr:hypothetical protein NC653_041465 [Populus alba x Populus x berolinensis]
MVLLSLWVATSSGLTGFLGERAKICRGQLLWGGAVAGLSSLLGVAAAVWLAAGVGQMREAAGSV